MYDKAAALFVEAARDTFNSYLLIHPHRRGNGWTGRGPSRVGTDVEDVIAKVLEMDSNNATVHESIAH